MSDTRKWNYSCFGANDGQSCAANFRCPYVVVAITCRHFTDLVLVESAEFVVEISTLSVIILDIISTSGLSGHIATSGCRT